MPSSFVCALFILVSSVQCDHNHLSDYCLATVGLHCATKMMKNKATTIQNKLSASLFILLLFLF